jgi:hypothetical protein
VSSPAAAAPDPQRFRVTYLCSCAADYAEGYGATVEEAERNVRRFWKRDGHRLRDIASRSVEHAVEHAGGGSHYEELGT